jgi:hypothetical protein
MVVAPCTLKSILFPDVETADGERGKAEAVTVWTAPVVTSASAGASLTSYRD